MECRIQFCPVGVCCKAAIRDSGWPRDRIADATSLIADSTSARPVALGALEHF